MLLGCHCWHAWYPNSLCPASLCNLHAGAREMLYTENGNSLYHWLELNSWKWGNQVEKNSGSFLIFERGEGQNIVLDHYNPRKQTLKLPFFLDIKDRAWIFSKYIENNELKTTFNFQSTFNDKNRSNFTFIFFSYCIAGKVSMFCLFPFFLNWS